MTTNEEGGDPRPIRLGRVRMEAELEAIAGHMTAEQREELARVLRRRAHQLEYSAWVLRKDAKPRRKRLKRYPGWKVARN